jgi:large subunit ribosomal protein L21
MYGVVEIAGHQYRVQEGDVVDVQKLDGEVGAKVEFDQVLFVGGKDPKVGAPTIAGAKVTGEIVKQGRSRKVIVFKRKPGKYQKKNGHRQYFTGVKITGIKA